MSDLPIDCERPGHCVHPGCFCPIRPHLYRPSWLHMGDCAICGHLAEAACHEQPGAPYVPPRDLFA